MTNANDSQFVFYLDKVEYKSEVKEGKTKFYVTGYSSTGDVDLVNDIVSDKCMKSMNSQFDIRPIKLDFEHETLVGDSDLEREANKTRIPLGKACERTTDSKGLKVKWELNPNWKKFNKKGDVVYSFKDVWQNVEDGYLDSFSIAYIPTKTASVEVDGKSCRVLDDVSLLNVALTGNPVNRSATMTAVMAKSLEFMKMQEETKGVTLDSVQKEVVEIKSLIENLSNKINLKGDKMSEEEVQKTEEVSEPVEEVKDTEVVEEATEKVEETEAVEETTEAEGKSGDVNFKSEIVEIKSVIKGLSDSVSELKSQVEKIDKVLSKPVQKSLGAEDANKKEIKSEGAVITGALDAI